MINPQVVFDPFCMFTDDGVRVCVCLWRAFKFSVSSLHTAISLGSLVETTEGVVHHWGQSVGMIVHVDIQ